MTDRNNRSTTSYKEWVESPSFAAELGRRSNLAGFVRSPASRRAAMALANWKESLRRAADEGDEEAKKCLEILKSLEKGDEGKKPMKKQATAGAFKAGARAALEFSDEEAARREGEAMDRAMGLPATRAIRNEGRRQIISAMTPEEARAELARRRRQEVA